MSCEQRTTLGAYVLGALEPAERAGMDRHLSGCASCRDELLELAPLPGLLRHTAYEEPPAAKHPHPGAAAPAPTDGGGNRQPPPSPPAAPRPGRRSLVAAALAAAAAAGGVSVYLALPPDGSPAAQPPARAPGSAAATPDAAIRLAATDPDSGVRAMAALTPNTWGTSVQLKLSGLPRGVRCRLVVHAADGRTEPGGSWASGYASGATVPASTSVSPQDITRLDVVTDDGRRLVRLERD